MYRKKKNHTNTRKIPQLRLLPLLKIPFAGTTIYYIGHVHLMIENLHDLRFRLNHAIIDDFYPLQIALEKKKQKLGSTN